MKQKNIYGDKLNPFEKVLGDTPELRVLQELLPLVGRTNVDNDETYLTFEEIAKSTGVETSEFTKMLIRFHRFDMIRVRKKGDTFEYALNKNSPAVQSIIQFNNALINVMLKNFQGNPT